MSTIIKRLSQNGQEFVPITLQEAVVVNTTNIPSLNGLGITTLDKVLTSTLGIVNSQSDTLNQAISNINTELSKKQNKLTPGIGIEITETGVINCTVSLDIYKIVTSLPEPGEEHLNKIYLVANEDEFLEYICLKINTNYVWEQFGSLKTDINIDNFVTKQEFTQQIESIQSELNSKIEAIDTTTSSGVQVYVSYDIPNNLYDSAVNDNSDQII